ncbi:hypothetical protein [Streptomyces sp. NPDC054865]
MTLIEPLASISADGKESACAHIAANVGPSGHDLPELTTLLDADLHHLVLDPETRTVWWASETQPGSSGDWTVDQLEPAAAAQMLSNHVDTIQDRQDDLTEYVDRQADPDTDQRALDEYAAILLLTLPVEPAAAAAKIKHRRRLIARQDALEQRAYALLVADLTGTERGGKTRAGRVLGITDVQVGRIIREDGQRRDALTAAVRDARAAHS